MNFPTEVPENNAPETGELAQPVRALRMVMDGRPTITTFTVIGRYRDRFEIHLTGEDRVVRVPRANNQTAANALRAFLTGGAQ